MAPPGPIYSPPLDTGSVVITTFGAGGGGCSGGGSVTFITRRLSAADFLAAVRRLRASGGDERSLQGSLWNLAQQLVD